MKVTLKEVIFIYNSYIANRMQISLLPIIWVSLVNGKFHKGRLLFADKHELTLVGGITIPSDNIVKLEIA